METKQRVEGITDYSVKIVKIFLDALEKFEGDYLFGKAELAYMQEQFSVWLKDNEHYILRLHELMDVDGHISDEQALAELYHQMKAIYQHAKSFNNAFNLFCGKRQINGVTAVIALFEATAN